MLPQALKVIFPALTSQIVIMMLESAVVSQIAVRELTYEADMLQARTFRAFETYFVVTLVYLGLSMALRRLLVAGGRRLFRGRRVMIEFTFWDIVRNLLLAARWTVLLSLVAFVGGARRRHGRSCCFGYPRTNGRGASPAATSRCSRARRC